MNRFVDLCCRGHLAAALLVLAAPAAAQLLPTQAVAVSGDKLFVVGDNGAIVTIGSIPATDGNARDVAVSSDGLPARRTASP